MSDFKSNEFLTSSEDYLVRPYNVGMMEHEHGLATILLYTDSNTSNRNEGDQKITDYLDDLSSKIETLEARDITTVGGNKSEVPGGKIATIKLDGVNDYYGVFNNFSLLRVNENSSQILKVHMNFGSNWNAFFFGKKPQIYTFSGIFLDTKDYPYYQEFMVAYENYLSGSKCVKNKMRMKMMYDGKLIDGYMVEIGTETTAENSYIKSFNFTVLVADSKWIRVNVISKQDNPSEPIRHESGFNSMSNKLRLRRFYNSGMLDPAESTTGTDSKAIDSEPPVSYPTAQQLAIGD
jgi:hypothetical protein